MTAPYSSRLVPYSTDAHKVWLRLTGGDPALLQHFEGFLTDMVEELRQSQTARTKMESHVKRWVTGGRRLRSQLLDPFLLRCNGGGESRH